MKTQRTLLVLVLLVLGLPAILLYQQARVSSARTPVVPSGPSIDIRTFPTKGDPGASIVLIEFSDYECPFCARHTAVVEPQLMKKYVATGRMRYAFANYPLPIHFEANFLAQAAICAGHQGKYWEMHDLLFEQRPKTKPAVFSLVKALSLDGPQFEKCVENNPVAANKIENEMRLAQRLGMRGTPGFALGVADAGGLVTVRRVIDGAQPIDVFVDAIEELMK